MKVTTFSGFGHLFEEPEHCRGLYFVVVDLMTGKDTMAILRDLNSCFPFPANETQVGILSVFLV